MTGVKQIAAERQRQLEEEGWTADHDDKHTKSQLTYASQSYLIMAIRVLYGPPDPRTKLTPPSFWPWENEWWKPSDDPIRNLVKAGALIAAEIDRLERAKERT